MLTLAGNDAAEQSQQTGSELDSNTIVAARKGSKMAVRRLAVIAGIAVLSTTIACGQASPEPQPSPSPITITLTTSGCSADGLGDRLQEQFVAVVVNNTSSRAAFNLRRVEEGHAYPELDQFIRERQQAIAAGTDIDSPPPNTIAVATALVGPGETGKLEGKLRTGTYGLICRRDSASGPAEGIYLRGPLRVG